MSEEKEVFVVLGIVIRVLKAIKFIFSGKHSEKKDQTKR